MHCKCKFKCLIRVTKNTAHAKILPFYDDKFESEKFKFLSSINHPFAALQDLFLCLSLVICRYVFRQVAWLPCLEIQFVHLRTGQNAFREHLNKCRCPEFRYSGEGWFMNKVTKHLLFCAKQDASITRNWVKINVFGSWSNYISSLNSLT